MVRGRRAAEALTVDGLKDRLSGLEVGARLFRDEVAAGRVEGNRVARAARPRASWEARRAAASRSGADHQHHPAPTPQSTDEEGTTDGHRGDPPPVRRSLRAPGATAVPSASLLLDDPNLLFVNAGMVPFKPYFLGQETPPYDRAVSVQKCVRTPDIEDVGKTTRHGTFFEMCGNFSFGDYFKEGAIELAWDLVTKPRPTAASGSRRAGSGPSVCDGDDEALDLWMKVTGLPDERIVQLGPKENYWSMGVPGPVGRARRSSTTAARRTAPTASSTTTRLDARKLEDRYLEIWNLVFMQDELSAVRSKEDFDIVGSLPKKNIDTGMGLERVAFLLQGKENMYEIDVMFPVIEKAEELTGRAVRRRPRATTSGSGSSPTTSAAR